MATPRLAIRAGWAGGLVLLWLGLVAFEALGASFPWESTYSKKPIEWYRTPEAGPKLDLVLANQSSRGDWPKNIDTSAKRSKDDPSKIEGTFDNGATVGEIRFLARAFRATGEERYRAAAIKGLDHILAAQYPNGGWPQRFPPGKGYARRITFNDGTMVKLLQLVRDASRSEEFGFLDRDRREAAGRAVAKGIECILACQVTVGGRLTAWCAQHDETTLEPTGARAFELRSLSGGESAQILALLMTLEDPSPGVVRAIEAGVRWYEEVKLTGIRQEELDGDKVIVADPKAEPLWARFYEIETNRPFFSGRDGVKVFDITEIEAERRNGYAWYGTWGEKVGKGYAKWKATQAKRARASKGQSGR